MRRSPLFIVGMPRSGTKLIRDLLNRNPMIAIPPIESHFIPEFVAEFGEVPHLDRVERGRRFFERFRSSTFYFNALSEFGPIHWAEFQPLIQGKTWPEVFEAVLRHYAPPERDADSIWGDKTPAYLGRLDTLREILPQVRFLHIIRDPRDCALSIHKIWGRSLFRAADQWRRRVAQARDHGARFPLDYREIRYEDLISDPEGVLRSVCSWLEIPYLEGMTHFDRPSEDLGDTKGRARIVSTNMGKYRNELRQDQILRIEEIVYPVAIAVGYAMDYAKGFRPASRLALLSYRIMDGITSLRFHMQRKGWLTGMRYYWALHRHRRAQSEP